MYNGFNKETPAREPVAGNTFREPVDAENWQGLRRIPTRLTSKDRLLSQGQDDVREPEHTVTANEGHTTQLQLMIKAGGTTSQPPRPAKDWRL